MISILGVCVVTGIGITKAEHQNQIAPQWYWVWRQPPYKSISSGGYPYILPEVNVVTGSEANPDHIYVGSIHYWFDPPELYPPGGIYRSTDRGRTWEHLGEIDPDEDIRVLAVHPVTPTILLAGFNRTYYQAGIYRSDDEGKNWTSVLPYLSINDIEIDPSNPHRIYASTLNSVAPPSGVAGVYRSDDIGQTWERVSDIWLQDIEVHPITPTTLFATQYFETGIYRSDDSGETWSQIASIGAISHITIDERYPDRMFAFGGAGIFRTEDGGESWADISAGLPSPLGYKIVASAAMTPLSEGTLLKDTLWIGMRYAGMFVSHDAGETWNEENDGIYFLPTFGTDCTSISFLSDGTPVIVCPGRVYVRVQLDQFVFLPIIAK